MFPGDFGPIYRETDLASFPVEPWNTASNLVFLAMAVFWLVKLRGQWREQRFLVLCQPLLLAGFIGGTLYHATRNHDLWLLLDVGAIMVLCSAVILHLWRKTERSWSTALPAVLIPVGFQQAQGRFLDLSASLEATLMYVFLAIPILLLLGSRLAQTRWRNWLWVLAAACCLCLALLCRNSDLNSSLPMGTHFLWHLLGAAAVQCLAWYIYLDDRVAVTITR